MSGAILQREGAMSVQLAEAETRVLTADAVAFVHALEDRFGPERRDLLAQRRVRNDAIRNGAALTFYASTAAVREAEWQVAAAPHDLALRHVEITGPVDRKMMIHALNSGADCFMADFEDSLSPTWSNVVRGQANLQDAVRRTISVPRADGSAYTLGERTATLLVRPRGWHLDELHMQHDGRPVSASLCDFGLHFFHNAQELISRGSGPYFYLPKLESHLEARLWNDVFVFAQQTLGVPAGTIRATVLIETLPAAFGMDEILYELRDHASGLNAGRWDYIFSAIKLYGARADTPVFPDRARITMRVPFMQAYTDLLVATCHRRGAHAMGGMAAFVPNRRQPDVTRSAIENVRADKEREMRAGFDGTWVAHPDLVAVAKEVFASGLDGAPHQKHVLRPQVLQHAASSQGVELTAFDIADGAVTLTGVRTNIQVAVEYITAWLNGQGAAAIDNLMEDVATAEISRTQLWHWLNRGAVLEDGSTFTAARYMEERTDIMHRLEARATDVDHAAAVRLLDALVLDPACSEFLTLSASALLDGSGSAASSEGRSLRVPSHTPVDALDTP
jgi:malate synthase